MGLDNGIYIENFHNFKIPKKIFDTPEIGLVCYWRKWWAFRDKVMNYFERIGRCKDCLLETDDIILELGDLEEILLLLKEYNEKNWTGNFWEWSEVRHNLKDSIRKMKWLIRFKKKHPDAVIGFMDSL